MYISVVQERIKAKELWKNWSGVGTDAAALQHVLLEMVATLCLIVGLALC